MTYIYEQLSTNEVARRLKMDEYAGWSHEGSTALVEYLEQLAEDTGEAIELDTVALRCEYSEYENLADYNSQYDGDFKSWDEVAENTTVIQFGSQSAIVQDC